MNRNDTPPSEVEELEEELPSSVNDFPEEARESVNGLMWLGFLEESVLVYGHEFVIRTLRVGEDLQVSLLTKEFADSMGIEQAVATATVALALKSIDGDPDFCPSASKNYADYARQRFRYIQENWYLPVIIRVFDAYLDLLAKQQDALERVEDLSTGSLNTFTPSPDSLTERANLEDQPEPIDSQTMEEIAALADSNED